MASKRLAAAVALLVFLPGLVTPAAASTRRAAIADGTVASMTDDLALYLEAVPLVGEGLIRFAQRLTGTADAADEIAHANGNIERLLAGVRYRVPFELLADEDQLAVIKALFPADQATASGWQHVVSAEPPYYGLWHVASWLTGRGESATQLRDANALEDFSISPGQQLLIPRTVLAPALLAWLPWNPEEVGPLGLRYERSDTGEFAIYRLAAGEALYSSVVVRFTGRTFANDVNAMAAEIATLNDVPDVKDMAIGQPVRIPLDLLLPEFLPSGHPRRTAYERGLIESAQFSNSVRTTRLEGITVILDPGHGGQDPGALVGDVWEATYVYDIALRARRLLLETTSARVEMTTRSADGHTVRDRDVLPKSRSHQVMTTPPYLIEDTTPGVHLRWYLSNSLMRKAMRANGNDADKVVFLSIHADALHASIRGAMIYVPAASLRRGDFGKRGTIYDRRSEVREKPRVSFSWKQRTKSEGLSRQLAEHVLGSVRKAGLAVHPEKPIRDRIIRSRRSRPFVPAVVRHNEVPAKVLVEVCNLSNRDDRRLLETRAFRQEMAAAIVDGILAYYGEGSIQQQRATLETGPSSLAQSAPTATSVAPPIAGNR